MPTDTLERASHLFAISEGRPPVERTDGGAIVRGLKIFRTGTFKDSRGVQRTWTKDDLGEIVSNFHKLETVFPNPPVRADHSTSVDKVKGHFTDARVEGEFLVGDLVFTEPEGADKYERGTYRNRSIEVGPYETNGVAPTTLWPTLLGMAFVDISAVEGLYRRENPEDQVTEPIKFRIRGVETTNVEDVHAYIAELEKRPEAGSIQNFKLAGEETADFAKVQSHIDKLETFRSEQMTAGRDQFVDKLVTEKKVAAPQADDLKTFAKSLDDAGYDAWVKTYEKAPALFTQQAPSGDGSKGDGPSQEEQVLLDLRETVSMHRRGGMTPEKIKATESYRKLVAISPADAIA